MRRLLAGCAAALVLLVPACSGDATGAPEPVDLTAESERLVGVLSGIPEVASADVQLRTGATSGNQVTIEAATSSTDTDGQREVLERVTEVGWHTAAFVPTEVRTSVVGPDGTTLDARDLGFPRRGADAAGLFALFGAPTADAAWRP